MIVSFDYMTKLIKKRKRKREREGETKNQTLVPTSSQIYKMIPKILFIFHIWSIAKFGKYSYE
jgi:hypothetical protein